MLETQSFNQVLASTRMLGIRIRGPQDFGLLNASRVVVVVAKRVDALAAAASSIQTLLERVHPRVDLQSAAPIAGTTWGAGSTRHFWTTRAHHSRRAASNARVVSVIVFLSLLLSSEIEEHDETGQNQNTADDTNDDSDNGSGLQSTVLD